MRQKVEQYYGIDGTLSMPGHFGSLAVDSVLIPAITGVTFQNNIKGATTPKPPIVNLELDGPRKGERDVDMTGFGLENCTVSHSDTRNYRCEAMNASKMQGGLTGQPNMAWIAVFNRLRKMSIHMGVRCGLCVPA